MNLTDAERRAIWSWATIAMKKAIDNGNEAEAKFNHAIVAKMR